MRTVRRLYVYGVAFISLEIVIWGAIGLGRSIFCQGRSLCGAGANLTQGLAAILVGIPFFMVHWGLAQRSARREAEERSSGVRALFLYGLLLATLIPIVQNIIALLDHLALQLAGLSANQAMFSPNQVWSDNLIAMVINAVFAAYFFNILRADWKLIGQPEAFADIRRFYRYVWLIYSLAAVIAAVQQLLHFILDVLPVEFGFGARASGAHGIVLALVGLPLWVFVWRIIQAGWSEPAERESNLRLGVLYLLSLAGVVTVLAAAGVIANVVLNRLLGEPMSLAAFTSKVSNSISIGLPLAGVWAYYGRWLSRLIAEAPEAARRSGLRRLYGYILSAIGLEATFIGLWLLLAFVVDAALGQFVWTGVLRPRLAVALATLLVSLPLWWRAWRPLQAEALERSDAGDHARRSLIRRIYLYLALFASVVGGMVVAVGLLNLLLRRLFGNGVGDLLQQVLKDLELLFLFVGLGLYHGWKLREDGRRAAEALAEKHAAFPVMVVEPGDGAFSKAVAEALQKQAPRLPVTIQKIDQAMQPDSNPRAVVLPAGILLDLPEPLRRWLEAYPGRRLAVPLSNEPSNDGASGWFFAGGTRPLPRAAAQAAQVVRQWAEGQEPPQEVHTSGWMVLLYVVAAFVALQLVDGLLALGISLLNR